MKRSWMAAAAAAAVAVAGPASAVWISVQLTPKGMAASGQHIAVKVVSDKEHQLKEVDVTITRADGKRLPPFASGDLSLIANNAWVASVPVSETRSAKSIEFHFKVAPEMIASSRFEIREQGFQEKHDENGKLLTDSSGQPEFEMTLGGQAYWFWLRDFAQ